MIRKYFTLLTFALLLTANSLAKGIDNNTSIFHTLQQKQSLYLIKRVENKIDTLENLADLSIPEKVIPDTVQDNRQEWIDRYRSVSYPLNKIKITSQFGNRKDPFTGKKANHGGLDLRAKYEEVYAMMYGPVIKVGSDKRSGHYITIRHGDYTVSYCHLSEILVKKGQVLAPGEPVAISGNTGRSTAPHLHITLKYKRKRINPMIILDYIKITKKKSLEGIISGKQSSTYR